MIFFYIRTDHLCSAHVCVCAGQLAPLNKLLPSATLCLQKVIKAKEANTALLRIIKNDLPSLLPPGCRRIGFEVDGLKVKLNDFARELCQEEITCREVKREKEVARAEGFGWKRSASSLASEPKKLRWAAVSPFIAKREVEADNIREGIPIVFCIGAVAKGNPGTYKFVESLSVLTKHEKPSLPPTPCFFVFRIKRA